MISVSGGTDDIADAMRSALQMIYASRIKGRILYHICNANISYGLPDIILLRLLLLLERPDRFGIFRGGDAEFFLKLAREVMHC